MVKITEAIIFIIASIIMGLCIVLTPECSGSVSITYIACVGLYLGVDIAGMILKTAALPKGSYKNLNIHKYVISSLCLLTNVGCCLYMKNKIDITTCLTSMISASMIVLTCVLGGLGGNKIATQTTIKG